MALHKNRPRTAASVSAAAAKPAENQNRRSRWPVPRAPSRRSQPPSSSHWPTRRSSSRRNRSSRPPPTRPRPKPQTPSDIINARGFWGDTTASPSQASPAQVAAIRARQALAAADPQPTSSVPAAYPGDGLRPAHLFHPSTAPTSSPLPRRSRALLGGRATPATAATEINTVAAKGKSKARTAGSRPRPG